MAGTEFTIPIWPGSSSFTAGNTPFGIYDNDTTFQTDIDKFAAQCHPGRTARAGQAAARRARCSDMYDLPR